MRKIVPIAFILFFSFSVFVTADIKFTYTWRSPEAEPVVLAGKKVAVILVSTNRAGRHAVEEALAKEITKRGAEGIASSALVTESELKDKEVAKIKFKEQGVAGAVVIRATPKGGQPVDPDMWKDPMYKDIWGFTSKSWEEEANPPKDVKFRVEIAVYSLEQDQMIWIGTTEMKSTKLVEFVQGIVDEIAEEMLKVGILVPKQ